MAATVHVVAASARTPVGLVAESAAAAVRAGISRIAEHPFVLNEDGDGVPFAVDARLEPNLLGWRRFAALASAAFGELLAKLDLSASSSSSLLVSVAMPETRPGFAPADATAVVRQLQAEFQASPVPLKFEIAARGHAGGLDALHHAKVAISKRERELLLVGGVDSYFNPETLHWLAQHQQLTGDRVRSGFIPGEAAAFVALASDGMCRQLRLKPLATVCGSGTAFETKLIKSDDTNLGLGLAAALRQATSSLDLPCEAVDRIYCDINGERYRSEEWGFAVLREQAALRDSGYIAPADCWGDVGAATGPLCLNLAAQSWSRRYAPGPRALVWAGSEHGLRAAVVLCEPHRS